MAGPALRISLASRCRPHANLRVRLKIAGCHLAGGSSWGPLTLVPGSDGDPNGGPRAVALRGGKEVLLTNSHGKLWKSSDSGASWASPVEMFKNNSYGALAGGGVMLQLSATHPTHPSRLIAAFDSDVAACEKETPYASACEFAGSYWSDDNGATFQLSVSTVPSMDESEVVELPDGALGRGP